MPDLPVIFTIGHSTHDANEFLTLLESHGIRQLVDVRTVPRSRRHPQFVKETLEALLSARGIRYYHFPELGGLRKPRRDSVNTAWRHPGFRGYADYMQTDAFRHALAALETLSGTRPTAVMCAEALWWHCHRRLLADALLVHGVPVRHISSRGEPKPHELSEFAQVHNGSVTYPGLL
jgi:uncharacterized protein (DUF488 family)